ncbi:hypothetical protein BaRGS_00021667 [Batillaria attramentaria]|uniref:Uncharacterized protein n=1 Tax=Batillaria attramentaria TaxID=370345 RepID=A0ABD0KJD0_9CAEN
MRCVRRISGCVRRYLAYTQPAPYTPGTRHLDVLLINQGAFDATRPQPSDQCTCVTVPESTSLMAHKHTFPPTPSSFVDDLASVI